MTGLAHASFNQDRSCLAISDSSGCKVLSLDGHEVLYSRASGATRSSAQSTRSKTQTREHRQHSLCRTTSLTFDHISVQACRDALQHKPFGCCGGRQAFAQSSLVALLVGGTSANILPAGEQPTNSPRRLQLVNTSTNIVRDHYLPSTILAVHLNRVRYLINKTEHLGKCSKAARVSQACVCRLVVALEQHIVVFVLETLEQVRQMQAAPSSKARVANFVSRAWHEHVPLVE